MNCSYFLEILAAVSFDWGSIVRSIEIYTSEDKKLPVNGTDIKWSLIPLYPACQRIDLNDYFDFSRHSPTFMSIYFNKISNLSVMIKVEDRRKSLVKRPLLSSTIDYEGSLLLIENLTSGAYTNVFFTFFENINLELGKGKGCRNYPTEKFLNYMECDMDFVYNEMKDKYKIMPFWAAKTLNEITNLT